MGTCASTHNTTRAILGKKLSKKAVSPVIKVINVDGKVKEFNPPICAEQILFYNPGCFVCSSDSMFLDSCPAQVPGPKELKPGHLYFVLSKSLAEKRLSLEDLCELAIKASTNLSIKDLQLSLSFRHYVVN